LVRAKGLEPPHLAILEPKSSASTNSATPAFAGKRASITGLPPRASAAAARRARPVAKRIESRAALLYRANTPPKQDDLMRSKLLKSVGFAALLIATPAFALQPRDPAGPGPSVHAPPPAQIADTSWRTELGFEPAAFRSHIMFLADDLLEGRDTGSRGHEIAARYVASEFAALGLRPGGNNGSWYQQVPFGVATQTGTPVFSIGGTAFPLGENVLLLPAYQAGPLNLTTGTVFAGYGRPEDYRGIDARGKVVVVVSANPQGLPSDVAAHMGSDKRRVASQMGAAGLIILRSPQEAARQSMSRARGMAGRPSMTWLNARGEAGRDTERVGFTAYADGPVADALFAGAPRTQAQVFEDLAANRPLRSFALRPQVHVERTTENRQFTSPNVIAVIPGTDPSVANEYVLLTAHLDHIGISPAGDNPNADRINNGAMDDGSGIATLLEVGKHFMIEGNRPRRPIILAAVTGEEKGLLGSSYLASNPTLPGRMVADVDLDMPILTYDFQDVVAFGAEHSTIGEAVRRAASQMHIGLSPDPLPEENLFVRSDHYSYVTQGVPAVFLMTGFQGEGEARFRSFLNNEYHSPADDMTLPFNWRAAAKWSELNYRITREIANAPEAPRWYQDSYFGQRFGGNQPRAQRGPEAMQPAPAPAPRPAAPAAAH
jgi:Peptidase family M28